MQFFEAILLFKAMNNTKTYKKMLLVGYLLLAAAKLFVCFCIVCGSGEEDSHEQLHSVLFCLIKKCSL